jgi:hypothetical protein
MMPGKGLPTKPEISLHDFFLQAWPYIDPADLVDGWPIQAVCEHLEAVSAGQISDLIICQPPRTAKSTCVSIVWPAWEWHYKPKTRFMYVSYAADLSNDHSIKTRRLIETSWYQSFWGERYQILPDRYKITMFENDHGGSRQATSVTGTATGFGADIVIFDDAADPRRAESEVRRLRPARRAGPVRLARAADGVRALQGQEGRGASQAADQDRLGGPQERGWRTALAGAHWAG